MPELLDVLCKKDAEIILELYRNQDKEYIIKDLSDTLGLYYYTVAPKIKEMAELGLVEKEEKTHSSRYGVVSKVVTLTEKGEKVGEILDRIENEG